jgi:hypothetical protein
VVEESEMVQVMGAPVALLGPIYLVQMMGGQLALLGPIYLVP